MGDFSKVISLRGSAALRRLSLGDPKQSIYAFRKADIYTYLAAQELLGADAVHHLDTNFRSDAPLIQGLNTFFRSPLDHTSDRK